MGLFLNSCFIFPDCKEKVYYRKTIKNMSGVKIKIKSINTSWSTPEYIYLLNNLDSLFLDGTYLKGPGGSEALVEVIKGKYADSIIVIFNNDRKIVYEPCSPLGICDNPRNIFDWRHVQTDISMYTFTPEDYANALLCNGSCE